MKKAFTLVELLAVVVILAVVFMLILPSITNTINDTNKESDELIKQEIISAAKEYAINLKTNTLKSLVSEGDCTYISISDLIKEGLLKSNQTNYLGVRIKLESDDTIKYILTDYPSCSDIILPQAKSSFADYTWPEIKTLAHAVTTGDLTYADLSNTYNLAVGQEKCITLNGFTTTNDNGCGTSGVEHSGFAVRIANMSNGESNTCGTAGFSESACGFVVEFKDIITKHNMNPSGTYTGSNTNYTGQTFSYGWNIGGWEVSSMRAYLNGAIDATTKDIIYSDTVGVNREGTIYNALPDAVKSIIADTEVVSGHGNGTGDGTNFTTTDKIYLLSTHEVWIDVDNSASNGIDYYDTAYANTRQLDYYKNNNVTTSNNKGVAIKYNGASVYYWWIRGAYSNSTSNFLYVNNYGDWNNFDAFSAYGVSPAFRIN